jgi:hypothetical protein
MELRFCDDFGADGFSWIVDEPMTRTSHALASDGKVWLVDPVDWPDAIERAHTLAKPAAVLQLLDRHNRDCASLAAQLGIPHVVAPVVLPDTPFECIAVKRMRRWEETALWWPGTKTLVVAEVLGTNEFTIGGSDDRVGVHVLLRLTPPKMLASYEPERLLVGHGEGVHGPAATTGLREALAHSRRGLPGVLLRLPFAGRS